MAEYLIQDTTLTAIADAIRNKSGKTDEIFVSDMPIEIAAIETGIELNFDVVGGTMQPTNPIENMIWVNTSTSITGWYFTAEQPENMTEGEVWFPIGTASNMEFNVLKENNITVCPLDAQQYIGGTLVDVTAMSYQSGEWIDWINTMYLYNAGNKCEDITGGWTEVKGSHGYVTWNSTSFNITYTNVSPGRYAHIYTKNKINVSNYKTLTVEVTSNTSDNAVYAGLCQSVYTGSDAVTSHFAAYKSISNSSNPQVVTIDISGLTEGSYYFEFTAFYGNVTVSKIYLD